MTTDDQTRLLLPLAIVIEDDTTLRKMFVGAQVVMTEYQPSDDDPFVPYGGFTLPQPLYYSRTMDLFFTLPGT
jgi:hypothetical protein